MITRRNWQLERLGITQWTLKNPEVLKEKIAFKFPKHIHLLLVSDLLPPINHPLVADVLRSMSLTPEQIYRMTPKQVMMLPDSIGCHCWWVGLQAKRNFKKMSLETPSLSVLSEDPNAKRNLWHQISNNSGSIITISIR